MSFAESVKAIADRVGIKIEDKYLVEGPRKDDLEDIRKLNLAAARGIKPSGRGRYDDQQIDQPANPHRNRNCSSGAPL